jgi:L-seryl-tRNA(Ser) seleniumtransferase
MQNPLRSIPSVNELLERPQLRGLVDRVSHNVVVDGVRTFLTDFRKEVQAAASEVPIPSPAELADRIAEWILKEEQLPLRPVINATGILLHTGLGRAPWPQEAIAAASAIATAYASVEVNLETGERSQRVVAVERLLSQLTGAEAACVVNNNAAATLLTLTALAAGKEVIVSRGQLVEIGGSFRLPEVMSASGARLKEVGTTNTVRPSDYEMAIGGETAALMRVHTSNFRVLGFTADVSIEELVSIGRKRALPVIDDIGSGALIDFSRFGIADEPVAELSIKAGADIVLFSGDKLLGGPQCGIIVGRRRYVQQIAQHPMMRAVRLDKVILAALAATLRLYRDPATVASRIPLLALLGTSTENLKNRAERLAPQLAAVEAIATANPVADETYLGGGSVPTQKLPTWCVALTPAKGKVSELAASLRTGQPAVFGRVQQDRLLLDLRTVIPDQDSQLVAAVSQLAAERAKQTASSRI